MEKIYALIGYPLSHSFSSEYFTRKFISENIIGCSYINFPIPSIDVLPKLIKEHENLKGINVTIPYKESVIPFLDQLSPSAKEIGAVNTVMIIRDEHGLTTKGYNTDVVGFERSLEKNNVGLPRKALILGTGGAAKAVEWVLRQYKTQIYFASRTPKTAGVVAYADINDGILKDLDLIINATPLGMHPNVEECPPIPYHLISPETTFFDLIYNPAMTLFLQKAGEQNCKTINGLFMLEQQAEKAWEIWNR